jgi:hypothetical protein
MIRTLGRTLLLSAMALVTLHSSAGAQEESPANREQNARALRSARAQEESALGRIPDFQKLLNQQIDYELPPQTTTLDKSLDELLVKHGVPYTVNEAAFGSDIKDTLKNTALEKMDKRIGVTRTTILKNLLGKIPNDGGKMTPTYVLRPDHLEITTRGALMEEFYPGWENSSSATPNPNIPELVYSAFKETPFRDALTELGHAAGVNVVLDGRAAGDFKVTAELNAVPFDAALRVLANMHDLKVVRIANIYYVTSPKNACQLQKEEDGRILKAAAVAAGGM